MLPKTLSASSLQVANLCLVRWKAEYLDRARGYANAAGNIGTTCHAALERFVEMVAIKKDATWDWKLLEDLYKIGYVETFASADYATDEYKDGHKLVRRWFDRTEQEIMTCEVLSVESKEKFDVPVNVDGNDHFIPWNFVIDRLDKIGPNHYRVVDYKTIRAPLQPEELMNKVQARAYALAVQIKYPDAEVIEVVFDQLRHERVGIRCTKADNAQFWYYLLDTAQRLVDTDAATIRPTLNPECGYCPVKATCPVLIKNISVGGIHSLSLEEVAYTKLQAEAQAKGLKYLLEELEDRLLREAYNTDSLELDAGEYAVEIKAGRRRQVDASRVADIIGPEAFKNLGSITLGVVDDLIKDPSLTPDQREQLKALITWKTADPKASVKKKKGLF